jgi:hypothetical protein
LEKSQRQALLMVTDSLQDGARHVAVLGNSLLLDGVDVPLLAKQIEPTLVPVPYFVLATTYYDWFFGLKRLFAEGMRPRYVLLGLSPNQLASPRTLGDYAARYLFQGGDLLEIARKTRMDGTTASGFFLSHFSQYYSTRRVTRGFVLSRTLPGVEQLLSDLLSAPREPQTPDPELSLLAAERLGALDQLCRVNGSRFMLVIPPTYQNGAETIARIGSALHVMVLVPVAAEALDATYYKNDGFHLNDKGARHFTTRLATTLLDELPSESQDRWASR